MSSDDLKEAEVALKSNKAEKLNAIDPKASALRKVAELYITEHKRAYMAMETGAVRLGVDANTEDSPIYGTDTNNVIKVLKHPEVLSQLCQKYTTATPSQYESIIKLIKQLLYSQGAIDFATVQPVALADDQALTWVRLPFTRAQAEQITIDQLPGFKHILGLCDDGGYCLTLWIGSLLDPKSGRAQYLHVQSDGGTGKSALLESIALAFGNQSVVFADSVQFNDAYFGELIEGARLLAFPDENSTSFFSSGKFKRYTGEPVVTINPKFKRPRNIHLTHKTLVISNNSVQITAGDADIRRLVSVVMTKDNESVGFKTWYEDLRNSGEKILCYCYAQYLKELVANPSAQIFIPANAALTKLAIERKYEELLSVFFEKFEVTGKELDKVRCSEVHKFLSSELREGRRGAFLDNITRAMEHVGAKKSLSKGITYYRGVKEVKGSFNSSELPSAK